MATPVEPPQEEGGNVLTQKVGPFAAWIWLLIITVVIVGYAYLKKGKAAPAPAGQATAGQSTAAQNVPDIIIQNQEPSSPAAPAPPAGSVPPTAPPPTTPPPPTSVPPVRTLPSPTPKPAPDPHRPSPVPPKAGPTYATVVVARWTAKNAPWNSTLSGIAAHYKVPGGAAALAKLNSIKNENLIYPGQKIKVPT